METNVKTKSAIFIYILEKEPFGIGQSNLSSVNQLYKNVHCSHIVEALSSKSTQALNP